MHVKTRQGEFGDEGANKGKSNSVWLSAAVDDFCLLAFGLGSREGERRGSKGEEEGGEHGELGEREPVRRR